jgi:rod shape-determining protein MreC
MKRIVLISTTAVILIVTFFSGIFIPKHALIASVNFAKQYLKTDFYQENVLLKLQNENLKAQLQRAQDEPLPTAQTVSSGVEANIFSTYPFNMKDTIAVDRGGDEGVERAMVATVADSILLGQVVSVEQHSSIIRTIFDSHWQLPVRIGPDSINGLFEGGNDPKVVLVEKPIKAGDGVFAASKDFPMGIKIGEIKDIKEDTGGIFKEATIRTPYNMSDIQTVYLRRM